MGMLKKAGNLGLVALLLLVAAGAGMAEATGTWTVDLSSVSGDVTTVGTAVLAVAALIFGFRIVRRMVGR